MEHSKIPTNNSQLFNLNSNNNQLSLGSFGNYYNQSNNNNSQKQLYSQQNASLNNLSFNPNNSVSNNNQNEVIDNSIINPVVKQLEILKFKLKTQEQDHQKDLENLQEKHENLLRKRDIEIKSYTTNLLNQINDLTKANKLLITENINLKKIVSANSVKAKIISKEENNEILNKNINQIKDQSEVKIKELENNFQALIKSINFNIFVGNNKNNASNTNNNFNISFEEQMYIYENKIKLIYEESFLKDKQIINLNQKISVLNEENKFLKTKFYNEKEVLVEKLNSLINEDSDSLLIQNFEKQISNYQKKLEAEVEATNEIFNKTILSLKEEIEGLKKENSKFRQENISLSVDLESLNKEKVFLRSKEEKINLKLQDNLDNYELYMQKIKILEKENDLLKEHQQTFNNKLGEFVSNTMSEKEMKNEMESQYREIIDTLKTNLDVANKDLKLMKEQMERYNKIHEEIKSEQDKKKSEYNELNQEVIKLRRVNADLTSQNKDFESYLISEKKKVYEYETKCQLLITEVTELRKIKSEIDKLKVRNELLHEENDNLKKSYSNMENKYEASKSDHVMEINRLKNQLLELGKNESKAEKSSIAEASVLEYKNELRMLKLSISRAYKSYYTSIQYIKTEESKILSQINNQYKDINENNSYTNELFPQLDNIVIPSYEETKMLDDMTSNFTAFKDNYLKAVRLQKLNIEITNEINYFKKQVDIHKNKVRRMEEENIQIKLKANNLEAKTKTNILNIYKQLKISLNNNSISNALDKSPLYAFLEGVIIHLRKQNIHQMFNEYILSANMKSVSTKNIPKLSNDNSHDNFSSSDIKNINSNNSKSKNSLSSDKTEKEKNSVKSQIANLESIMKQAENGYNDCIKRSKNYVSQEEVKGLIEKFRSFNSEIIDYILKTFIGSRVVNSNETNSNDVSFKLNVNDFNNMLDKVASKSDSYWEGVDKMMETYTSASGNIENCIDVLMKEGSIETGTIEKIMRFIFDRDYEL